MIQNRIIMVFGRKGSGKTTAVQQFLRREPRFIVVDTLNEYTVGKVFDNLPDFSDYARGRMKGTLRAVVRIGSDEEFERLAEMVKVLGRADPILFVIEEADIRCSPQYIPAALDQLIRYGRHWGVSILAVSRRPAEISRHLTAQADTIVAFQTYEPRDVEFFRKRCGEDFAARVACLPRFKRAVWGEDAPARADGA